METISLKEIAKMAKARLKNGNYYVNQNKRITNLYNNQLVDMNKVIEIVESEEIIANPIQRLINKEYYNTLTNNVKQKYIFDVARNYLELKQSYLNSKKSTIK